MAAPFFSSSEDIVAPGSRLVSKHVFAGGSRNYRAKTEGVRTRLGHGGLLVQLRQALACVALAWLLCPSVSRARELASESGLNGGLDEFGSENRTVANCIELQRALGDSKVIKVFVVGDIRCTRATWHTPVLVRRNVEVTGEIDEAKAIFKDKKAYSIDWTDVSKVVVAERGAVIFFHHLLLYQDEMGIGLNLAFIQTRKGATGVFAGLVVVVGSCPQPVSSYNTIASRLPRPEFLAGSQTTHPIDQDSLLVKDVAIWWPNINSLWQICNTVFICGVSSPASPRVAGHFDSSFVVATCNGVTTPATLETVDTKEGSGGDDSATVAGTMVGVAIVIGVVLLASTGLAYFLYGQRNNRKAREKSPRVALDQVSKSGRSEGTEWADQTHSAAYDLFEKNINVPLQDVEVGPLLGRGGFGKVYKGTWKGTTVAIKVIEHGERLMENELKLPFEAYLSKHMSHPNVVQTFLIHTRQQDSPHGLAVDTADLNVDSLNRAGPPGQSSMMSTHDIFSNIAQGPAIQEVGDLFETWLVLEYCDRGSLSKAVRKGLLTQHGNTKPMMDHVILSALDVANAMNYLHSLGITHGDLKADNVLLKSANTDRRGFFCKVSDFGLSRFMGNDDFIQTFTYGTITHMPPELLKDGILSPSVDVYSFGMLLWELLSQSEQPYPNKNHGEIILTVVNEGRRPHFGPNYPELFADLIRDCWKQSRHDRPKFPDIVRRLKGLLADLESGVSGSPSKSMSRSVNDSAASLRKRPNMFGRRNVNVSHQKDVITSMPEVRTTLYYDGAPSPRGKEMSDEKMEPADTDEQPETDEQADSVSSASVSESRSESMEDAFTSAQSHMTRSTEFSSNHTPYHHDTP
ncbi:hypothetical protein BSKO_00921 [Bryopsis sp. KO-2023]|nr:hypothetical protein BSKO_00921 [Bryopsis sp. KO-2023]